MPPVIIPLYSAPSLRQFFDLRGSLNWAGRPATATGEAQDRFQLPHRSPRLGTDDPMAPMRNMCLADYKSHKCGSFQPIRTWSWRGSGT